MKKILGLLCISLFFGSCDDGDVVVESISLNDAKVIKCEFNTIFYKINENQSMLLEINETTNFPIKNEIGSRSVLINNTTNKLLFRTYFDKVKSTNICGTTLDAFPSVKEEWIAEAGTVRVITTYTKKQLNTQNSTRLDKFNHAIVLDNIVWLKQDGSKQIETIERPYGIVQTNPTYDLTFGFDEDPSTDVIKSSCDKSIFNFSGKEALRLKLTDATFATLFSDVASATPKTALISDTNTLTYLQYNNLISNDYFCATTTPNFPILVEEWKSENGVLGLSGIISVVTSTQTSTQFKHTISLKGVTFKKGSLDFYYGDIIEMGSFITP